MQSASLRPTDHNELTNQLDKLGSTMQNCYDGNIRPKCMLQWCIHSPFINFEAYIGNIINDSGDSISGPQIPLIYPITLIILQKQPCTHIDLATVILVNNIGPAMHCSQPKLTLLGSATPGILV